MSSRMRQWKDKVEDGIQELKGYIGKNFSSKHGGYFNARFDTISSASKEMMEEFERMVMMCRTMTGIESVVRERAVKEDERIARMEANIVGGLEVANKVVTDRVTAEIDRCMTVLQQEESGRKKEGDSLEKVIRETRSSLKEEIDGMAEVMKKEMMGAIERKIVRVPREDEGGEYVKTRDGR